MPPISCGPRSNSRPAAASPSLSRRTSSPPRVRPPSTDRPCRRRSLSARRWEAVRASFRLAAVSFVVCRYVRCGEDSRWIWSAVATFEHPEHAQRVGAVPGRRSRLVRLALRHQPRPPVVRVRPPAGRRPRPAAEGSRCALNPMIASTTDTPPPPISQGLVSERRREEGCDGAPQPRKGVVCWANAINARAGHGSGYGSGIASADGRRRRLARPTSPPGAGRAARRSTMRSGYGGRLCWVIIPGLSLVRWRPPPAL